MRTCGRCEDLLTGPWTRVYFGSENASRKLTYHGNMRDLSTSCDFCLRIYQFLKSGPWAAPKKDVWNLWGLLEESGHGSDNGGTPYSLQFTSFAKEGKEERIQMSGHGLPAVNYYLVADHGSEAAPFIPGRPHLADPRSDLAFTYVNQWLSECDEQHHDCQRNERSRPFMPRRVIDVGDRKLFPDVRICETANMISPAPYVALSYCWGSPSEHQQRKMLRNTLVEDKIRVLYSTLPGAVQDAITVTRRLKNVRYLWVDALCIIQDDNRDKQEQLATMGDVYEGAYLTISAVSSKGCSSGFLDLTEDSEYGPYISMRYRCLDGIVRPIHTTQRFIRLDRMKNGRREEPLNARGWTFQETVLSRRVLFYTLSQPYWHCKTKDAEAGGITANQYFRDTSLSEILRSLGDRQSQPNPWPWFVHNYSRRIFSDLEDKLPAMKSIADKYEEHKVDQFLYGLWESSFARDLLWAVETRHCRSLAEIQAQSSDLRYNAQTIESFPSWSWMRIDGEVKYEGTPPNVEASFKILEPLEADEFGRVTNLPLCIEGRIKRVIIKARSRDGWKGREPDVECFDTEYWDVERCRFQDDPYTRLNIPSLGTVRFDEFDCENLGAQRDEELEGKNEYIYCFVVAEVGTETPEVTYHNARLDSVKAVEGRSGRAVRGLILKQESLRKWRRLGIFWGNPTSSLYFKDAKTRKFELV